MISIEKDFQPPPGEANIAKSPIDLLTLFVGFALVVVLSCMSMSDPDTWWLIADGKRILSGDFSNTNGYSHLFADHAWQQTQWLFSVLLAAFSGVFGTDALSLLVVVFAVAIFAAITCTTWDIAKYRPFVLFIALLLIALVLARFRFAPRAHLATLLGLVVVHALWLKRIRHLPLALFAVGLLWANLHSGVVFGVALVGVLVLDTVARKGFAESKTELTAAALFLVTPLLNPFGSAYAHVYHTFTVATGQGIQIGEMQAPELLQHPTFVAFALVSAVAALVFARRREFLPAGLFLVFVPLAFFSKRTIPFFAFLLLPYVAAAGADFLGGMKKRAAMLAVSLVFISAAGGIAYFELQLWWRYLPVQYGIDVQVEPVGAADFIERAGVKGKMYNTYMAGGYLAWRLYPGRGIFIDGRVPAYPPEVVRDYWASITEGPERLAALLDKYSLDYAVVLRSRDTGQADLVSRLRSIGWTLVYMDGVSTIYVRPERVSTMGLEKYRLSIVYPGIDSNVLFGMAKSDPAKLAKELGMLDPGFFHGTYEMHLFGTASFYANDLPRALAFFERGLELAPDDPGVLVAHANTLFTMGRVAEAVPEFKRVIELAPGSHQAQMAASVLAKAGYN